MADLRIDLAAEFKGKKAFKEADKATSGLEKAVGSLGKKLIAVFAVQKIAAFGKASVKAFIEDEKAVTKLNTAIKNLGLELSAPSINKYIENLSRVSGVADDQLRPAFQALITTTGSVTASQKALQQAIDISAGSGIALETVAQDLANAYVGNTKGLKKYNLGLTQAQLKSASFADISEKLNKQFSGANAAYLETYAGKLQLINTAAGEAQEKIGQGLIDLAMAVTGASDVQDLIGKIASATDFAVSRLDNFIEGWKLVKAIINSGLGDFNKNIQAVQVEEFNRRLKRDYLKAWAGTDIPKSAQQVAAEKAAEKAARARAAALEKATKANTAELKKQALLKKSASIFDLEQIQLIAALKGNLSEEDRKRVELQFALLTGNTEQAQKLTYEIAKAQGLGEQLARFLATLPDAKNPFASWNAYLDMLMEKARQLALMSFSTQPVTGNGSTARGADFAAQTPIVQSLITNATGTNRAGVTAGGDVYVTVQGNVVTQDELVAAVQNGLQLNSLSGSPSVIGRIAGMFG